MRQEDQLEARGPAMDYAALTEETREPTSANQKQRTSNYHSFIHADTESYYVTLDDLEFNT